MPSAVRCLPMAVTLLSMIPNFPCHDWIALTAVQFLQKERPESNSQYEREMCLTEIL